MVNCNMNPWLLNHLKVNSDFNMNNPLGLNLLTRLRIGFSHINNINLNTIFKIL